MDRAVRSWAEEQARREAALLRLGYFGSYARGDWGVGSDLDLVALLRESALPFERRGTPWDLSALPVPADLLVYTKQEWRQMRAAGGRFIRTLVEETVWVFSADPDDPDGGPG